MQINTLLEKLYQQNDLNAQEMIAIMQVILQGQMSDVEITAFVIALKLKGLTQEELLAAVKVLRTLSKKVELPEANYVDIVGTGGDESNTFNVSTASMFVAAAAGVKMVKHGNVSVSSRSGSADVLEALGVNLYLSPEQIQNCVRRLGLAFIFAPMHHQTLQHVANVRRLLKTRTLFNLLGPLINPCNAKRHVIGVYDKKWLLPFAQVLQALGSEHALILHADDGLDEISISAETNIVELKDNEIREYKIQPADFALDNYNLQNIRVSDVDKSKTLMLQALQNKHPAASTITTLNAGAAIYVAGVKPTLAEAIDLAKEIVASQKAFQLLQQYITLSISLRL
ncbi:MAG: anthranilate phosphoribosyltransferase [Pseudomonadota bacterium]